MGGSSRVSPVGEENSRQSAFDEPHQTRKARKSPHQIEFPRTRASPNGLLREPPPLVGSIDEVVYGIYDELARGGVGLGEDLALWTVVM